MSSIRPLENTAALVTGASSGLGLATALRLREAGAYVVGLDLSASNAVTFDIVSGDVADPQSVTGALDVIVGEGRPLRIVANCAGIRSSTPVLSEAGPHPLHEFRKVLEVNLVGTFNVIRLAAEVMSKSKPDDDGVRGCIINTASVAAYEGLPNQAAYTASKAAVAGLTLQLARDLSRWGIRVNAIAPGVMETPILAGLSSRRLTALQEDVVLPKRLGRPSEFAEMVLALAVNNYANGAVIRLDGALRMQRG